MPTETVLLNIEESDGLAGALSRAAVQLESGEGELALDFSAVGHVDSRGLDALSDLMRIAEEKGIRVSVTGVNVGVYKVLKLMKLTQRLSFPN